MRIDSKRVIEILKEQDNFLILTHKSPDGDTLGTGTALCIVLQNMGKNAKVVNSEVIPKKYEFLFENIKEQDFEPSYIVAVDVADTSLLGEKLSVYADKVDLCIDHHGTNRAYAKELHLCADDGACALTLYRILVEMGAEITEPIANSLYTGISTDTGCFRYQNANSECYRAAADLIDLGADNAGVNTLMFETKSIEYFRLLTEVLSNMKFYFGGKVSVLTVTQEMFKRTGTTSECTDAITATSRQMEGVVVGITMKERENGTFKISLRTHEPVDASYVCSLLGGGGHVRAAGCDAKEDLKESLQILLDAIADELSLPRESV